MKTIHQHLILKATFLMAILAPTLLMAAEKGGGGPFEGSFFQFIASVSTFLVLATLLYKKAWGPILKGLQDREKKIADDLAEAERANKMAQDSLEAYRKQMADSQEEARKLLEEAKADAEKLAAQLKAKAETEVTALRERATREIESAKDYAIEQVNIRAGELSVAIASQILKREINADDQKDIIERSLAEVDRTLNMN